MRLQQLVAVLYHHLLQQRLLSLRLRTAAVLIICLIQNYEGY